MRAKAAMAMGTTTASAPPARTTSAVPSRISRAPSPTAWVPAAQAVATQTLGPVQPSSMARMAGVALGIIIGTRNGVTRVGPRSMRTFSWSSSVARPPMPTPATTAQRAGSAPVSPASRKASIPAAKPSWALRSTRRTSLGPRYSAPSKSLTWQAKRTGRSVVSKLVISAAIDRPASRVSQKVATSLPAGVFTPRPVMTTRGRPRWSTAGVVPFMRWRPACRARASGPGPPCRHRRGPLRGRRCRSAPRAP